MLKFFFSEDVRFMRFSEWLKTYRKRAGISQETLARRITAHGYKISGAQISNYEREYDRDKDGNPTRPSETFVQHAAEVLSCPLDEARAAAGYAHDNLKLPAFLAGIDFQNFTDSEQSEIRQFIEFVRLRKHRESIVVTGSQVEDLLKMVNNEDKKAA